MKDIPNPGKMSRCKRQNIEDRTFTTDKPNRINAPFYLEKVYENQFAYNSKLDPVNYPEGRKSILKEWQAGWNAIAGIPWIPGVGFRLLCLI